MAIQIRVTLVTVSFDSEWGVIDTEVSYEHIYGKLSKLIGVKRTNVLMWYHSLDKDY